MKKRLSLLIIIVLVAGFIQQENSFFGFSAIAQSSDQLIQNAFHNRQGNIQVQGRGKIIKILSDDVKGSRHQRFIIKLNSGLTLLVAHNIDLAPRINQIATGTSVEFYGEYEWNTKGGVIHWTHHDPSGNHPAGWLKYQGKIYQ